MLLMLCVTLCKSSPIHDVAIVPSNQDLMSSSNSHSPSVHAADKDIFYEDNDYVFNDSQHYENLGCDSYGYAYEDY